MSTQRPLDLSNATSGLQNILTGFNLQSPSLSPSGNMTPSLADASEHSTTNPTAQSSDSTLSPSVTTSQAEPSNHHSTTSPFRSQRIFSTPPRSKRPRHARQTESGPVNATTRSRSATVKKEVDDPTHVIEGRAGEGSSRTMTPSTLTRLFAVTSIDSPSRPSSSQRTTSGGPYTRATTDTAPLPDHLYTRGFLNGRHSDIVVNAFSTSYPLHRILLDRAPFFSSALSEPWCESTAKEITLRPDDIDSNITKSAFELALKRLYGFSDPAEEDMEAAGLLATACWLEMADLVESSTESLLRQLDTANVAAVLKLAMNAYYGEPGDRLLSAAKAKLFRDGWEMHLRHWDQVPSSVVRDIVAADAFFVSGEWERWRLAKRLLDRRLRALFAEEGYQVCPSRSGSKAQSHVSEQASGSVSRESSRLDSHPDIEPLLELLDEGIHYTYLSFEQLQSIRLERDILGRPVVSEEVLSRALWASMELRQKILNVRETEPELGLQTVAIDAGDAESGSEDGSAQDMSPLANAEAAVRLAFNPLQVLEARRYHIPSADTTRVLDDMPHRTHRAIFDDQSHGRSRTSYPQTESFRRSSTPTRSSCRALKPGDSTVSHYTHYPPYRFSVEFPNPRLLKEKKRVYSRTVWYAGSSWNLYIQKIRTSKNVQLGVYLHRAKEHEGGDSGETAAGPRSVDEAIGHLEREMLLRRTERRLRREQQYEAQLDGEGESSSGGEATVSRIDNWRSHLGLTPIAKGSQSPNRTGASAGEPSGSGTQPERSAGDDEGGCDATKRPRVAAVPPYVDARPTIRTYFKIYSPTKGGRTMSVYESAPDGFNFSQSWGWKSNALIFDDGLSKEGEEPRSRDGRLRFSVVLGNV
ncbi:MAG: hypothetical protein M1817_003129 [Caeruleum heppii]|nr:MAG: hypothetical protein M1817_003129 [Caeruleum heppii]